MGDQSPGPGFDGTLCDEQTVTWRWQDAPLPIQIRTYLTSHLPPIDLVTSVRALVLIRNEAVVVIRDPNGHHLVPGGRRERGESLEQTLRREIKEETGWDIEPLQQLAVLHFHHLGARPQDYTYPHPDFFQVVWLARAIGSNPSRAPQTDQFELEVLAYPLDRIGELDICSRDRALLKASIEVASQPAR
jgi:8-oxo-dGTP diphosphatase